MKNYEITFIVDPVLSGEEIKSTAQTYVDLLQNEGCKIVHVDEMGLKQLAYAIKKRTSGVYYCIEFETPTGELIGNLELSLRRDERIIRFLTVALDKFGVKYNEDKRNGKIGKVQKKKKKEEKPARNNRNRGRRDNRDRRQDRDRREAPAKNKEAVAKPAETATPTEGDKA